MLVAKDMFFADGIVELIHIYGRSLFHILIIQFFFLIFKRFGIIYPLSIKSQYILY